MSEISEVVAGQVNERFLEVPTNATYFADLDILNGRQPGAQNPFDSVVREVTDLGAVATPWAAWTPTVSPQTGTITTLGPVSGRYKQVGKIVFCLFSIVITTKGTAAGACYLTLPVAPSANIPQASALGNFREALNAGYQGVACLDVNNFVFLISDINVTPFVANGDTFRGSFTYEAA